MSILRHRKQKKNSTQDNTGQRITKQVRKKKRKANRQILQITYMFVGLFLALIAYIAYFVAVDSKNVITDPHNRRLQSMAEKVVRGKIISSDGKVLAQTLTENGKETRDYPYGRCLLYTSPSPRDGLLSRMPSSA